ncbi:MAG: haloalkane dehalogenase [Acidimicrobiia bacterium]|nr:haloalkane dehalogenase [Acidimicrobiia bacterium]
MLKQRIDVLGSTMAFVDVGAGDPVVFLHGNPTSSFLWRDVIPHLSDHYRCIAPDLIGMGDSAKLDGPNPDRYRFVEHRRYLDALFDALDLGDRVTLVVHDWGSGLGFDWANRHRDRVVGIAYMEAIVRPVSWDEWPAPSRGIFEGFRSDAGEGLILERNLFVERVLPGSVIRTLTDAEMDEYRRPFLEPGESRRPTLAWPREIPIDGEPADVTAIVASYAEWLETSRVPKLLIEAEPGAILTGSQLDDCRRWPNQTRTKVPGIHFLQEDSSEAIGIAVRGWRDLIQTRRVSAGQP